MAAKKTAPAAKETGPQKSDADAKPVAETKPIPKAPAKNEPKTEAKPAKSEGPDYKALYEAAQAQLEAERAERQADAEARNTVGGDPDANISLEQAIFYTQAVVRPAVKPGEVVSEPVRAQEQDVLNWGVAGNKVTVVTIDGQKFSREIA